VLASALSALLTALPALPALLTALPAGFLLLLAGFVLAAVLRILVFVTHGFLLSRDISREGQRGTQGVVPRFQAATMLELGYCPTSTMEIAGIYVMIIKAMKLTSRNGSTPR
jgi:hypothetical protein